MTLALAVMRGPTPDPDDSAETVLAKLIRVLPRGVSDRVADVLTRSRPPPTAGWPAEYPTPVCWRHWPRGSSNDGAAGCGTTPPRCATVREVNPYGVAVVRGWCYVHGWCHLRQARRTFRIDRIDRVELLDVKFRMPGDLDVVAAVESSLALARPEWPVSLPRPCAARRGRGVVPPLSRRVRGGRTRRHPAAFVDGDLDYFVLRISDHPFAMTVEEPTELRDAFARAAARMAATGAAPAD